MYSGNQSDFNIVSQPLIIYSGSQNVTTQTRKQSTGVIEELSVNLDHYFQLVEMETTNKDIEFQALQAQINPHFLYNVLDTINWMARKKGEEKICQIVFGIIQIRFVVCAHRRF